MSAHLDFAKANEQYASTFDKGSLSCPPAKQLTIVTCMDARLETFQQLGISEGQANIIRNAGGTVRDELRSILVSQRLLGTREIAVFHHTDCGMLTFTTPQLQNVIKAAHPDDADIADQVDAINFMEFADVEESVKSDVKFLQENPLIVEGTKITGWIYHVENGKITQVV